MNQVATGIEYLLPGARLVLAYAERLIKEVSPEQARRKPLVGGVHIDCNHPVFVFGHLALYPVQLARMSGLSCDGLSIPENYTSLFQMGAPCLDDPEGSIYPSLSETSERFFSSTRLLLERLPSLSSDILRNPLENPQRQERFGSIGAFVAYILLAHPQSHFGQISIWRRCMGLGPC